MKSRSNDIDNFTREIMNLLSKYSEELYLSDLIGALETIKIGVYLDHAHQKYEKWLKGKSSEHKEAVNE